MMLLKSEILLHLPEPIATLPMFSLEKLTGGVSGETYKLGFNPNSPEYWVLKKYGDRDLKSKPNLPELEYQLLSQLHSQGIAVLDSYPVKGPYLLTRYVSHFPTEVLATEMAEILAKIHKMTFPERLVKNLRKIDSDLSTNFPCLLHGDFWPGNMIISEQKKAIILDWEDAVWGDPVCEVSRTRVELYGLRGRFQMLSFTNRYQTLQPALDYSFLREWDHYHIKQLKNMMVHWPLENKEKHSYLQNLYLFELEL